MHANSWVTLHLPCTKGADAAHWTHTPLETGSSCMHPSPEQNTTTARSHRSQRLLAQACRHSVEGPTEGVSKSDIDEMPAAFAQDHRACGWVRGQDKKPESPCNEMKLLERYEPHGCIAGPPSAPFPPVSKLHETCAGHGHTSPNIDARGPGGSHATKKACPAFSSRPWTPPPRDSAAWSFHFCMFRVVRFVCNALFSCIRRPWEPDE